MSLVKLAARKTMATVAKSLEDAVPKDLPSSKLATKTKGFLNRHKGKILLGGLAGAGIGAYLDKKRRQNESY